MIERKIALNAFYSTAGRVIGTVLSLIALGLMTRYLGKMGYGQYATALAFVYGFSFLANLGLYNLMVREISRPGSDEKKVASNLFTLRVVASIFFLSLAPLTALFFPYPFVVKLGIALVSIHFLFLSFQQVLIGIFQKYLEMHKVALGEVLGRIGQLFGVLFFIRLDFGVLGMLWALVFSALVNFGIVFWFARKLVAFGMEFDFAYWKALLREALPIGISIILTVVYFKLDTILLSLFREAPDVGIYNLAYKILESLIFFPAMFVGLVMPQLSKYAFRQKRRFQEVFQRAFDVLLILALPMCLGLYFKAEAIVTLIGGAEFLASKETLQILTGAIFMIFFGALLAQSIIAWGRQRKLMAIYGSGLILNLGANLIFIPRYSYIGASWTTVATETLVTGFLFLEAARLFKFWPKMSKLPSVLGASLALMLFLSFAPLKNLFGIIFLSVLVYFSFLYLFGGIRAQELKPLLRPK